VTATDIQCFRFIEISDPELQEKRLRTQILCEDVNGKQHSFMLFTKYEKTVEPEYLSLLRVASVMPVLNYGLFAGKIKLKFEVSRADLGLLEDLLAVFSKDIFVNKLVRKKNPYILPQFVPDNGEVTEENAKPLAKIAPKNVVEDSPVASELNTNACGVLSSGGKESMLTYSMLKEVGASVYPLYVNESGGHWRTALPAYRYHMTNEPNTSRVWSNVDRFYSFMLDHMRIIRTNHRKIWADTYPIRLCIFPVYIFLLLPIFASQKIGNLLIGSEFDDPRFSSFYKGVKHYYGVYDQTQDFDLRMEEWYKKRMSGMRQWSAVRPISGLIVERILTKRYPAFARFQRSCHSCRFENENILPCGDCSKCLGIMLFLRANNVDPTSMGYDEEDAQSFPLRLAKGGLRLDDDEREHAIFLTSKIEQTLKGTEHKHVESIHLHKATGDLELVPTRFRVPLLKIFSEYTKGFTAIDKDEWVQSQKPKEL